MAQTNTVARSLHDLGLATWFGGSLMGAVALNDAAGVVDDPGQRARVANAGWARWTPVNLGAIGAHLLGALVLTRANRGRLALQEGVAGATTVKGILTLAALGLTAYSRMLGQKVMNAGDVPVADGTEPATATPPEVEDAQRRLRTLQWAIPAVTGAMLVTSALMSEQQRPNVVAEGVVRRLLRRR